MMVKAFSVKSLSFDHLPGDDELVWLLGDSDAGPLDITDTAELLTVRPQLLPMKFVAVCLLLPLCAMAAAPWWTDWDLEDRNSRHWYIAMMIVGWFFVLPGMLAIFGAMNERFAAKGDYLRLDKQTGRLELCQHGRTFEREDLIAFTLLTRYLNCIGGGFDWTRQLGALIRAPDGSIELLPILREIEADLLLRRLATRLGAICGVPVRTIELGWRASRALKDN